MAGPYKIFQLANFDSGHKSLKRLLHPPILHPSAQDYNFYFYTKLLKMALWNIYKKVTPTLDIYDLKNGILQYRLSSIYILDLDYML